YFGELEVLKGIDFNVEECEVVGVIGPSGSGKSTLLRCLNRLEEKTSGELIIDGDSIGDKQVNINEIRAEVGMVFQQFNLFPHKSVLENIMLAPMKVRKSSRKKAKEKEVELLEKVGLADKAKAYPRQLS